MAEWSIAAVLKTVKPKGFGGSNPSVSARFFGEMPEWSIGAVSKTVERFAFQGFESLSLRTAKALCIAMQRAFCFGSLSGLMLCLQETVFLSVFQMLRHEIGGVLDFIVDDLAVFNDRNDFRIDETTVGLQS